MPVVYADVVWLVNFVMDAMLLATSAWIAKRDRRWRRILLGALIGSAYAMLLFLPRLSTLTTWPGKAIASLIMVYVAIPHRGWLDLLRNCALFYFVAFVFAGAALAMHYAIPGVSMAGGTIVGGKHLAYVSTTKSLSLVVAIVLGTMAISYATKRASRLRRLETSLLLARLSFNGSSVEFMGLADTGNQLRHPLTGRPVCLVELGVLGPLLPDGLSEALVRGEPVYDAMSQLQEGLAARFTVVPLRGAGGNQTFCLAFRPDGLTFASDDGKETAAGACLIGIHVEPLSADGRFQAILHIDAITGDDQFEDSRPADGQHQAPDPTAALVDSDSSQTGWGQ